MNDATSQGLYRRALEVMPGGVNSPVRAMGSIGRDPIFIASAAGCELTDADGNTYIDWISSWGPLICGHANPEIVAAVSEAAARGTSYGAAASDTAATISGLAWPQISGPQEEIQSMYVLPSASVSSQPEAEAMKIGSRPIEPMARTGELTPPGITARARR